MEARRAGERPAWDDLVSIGRLARPWGRSGELIADVFSDRPDRFATLRSAWVRDASGSPRLLTIEGTRPHQGRALVRIRGVDSIEAADGYRGLELRIEEADLAPLPEGSYYHHQLRGLRVEEASGAVVGRVEDVFDAGAGPVLVIGGDAGETLLPLVDSFVERVDVAGGRLVACLPETTTC